MSFSRNRLYGIILTACIAGYTWIYLSCLWGIKGSHSVNMCFIKSITKIPCPSCGSTRSVLALINGRFLESLYLNPMGFLIAIIIFFAPIWIISDMVTKSSSFLMFYSKMERYLKKPAFSIPLILLVIINWIWNIKKGI